MYISVVRGKGLSTSFQIFLQAFAAQFAGGAIAAAFRHDAVVAGERLGPYKVEHAQLVGQLPYLAFVPVHQGGVDDELFVHRQVQGDVEGTDERIAAIGITAEIGFRHAGYEVEDTFAACQDGGEGQEYHVASRDEGVRIAVCRFFPVHRNAGICQRAVRIELAEQRHVQQLERNVGIGCDLSCDLYFKGMFLPVCEAYGFYAGKVLLGPEQASRGVLPAGEAYQSGFLMFHIFLVFSTWFSKHTEKETFLFGCKDTSLIEI